MPEQAKHIGSFIPEEQPKDSHFKGKNYLFVIAIDEYEYCPRLYNAVKDADDLIALLSEKYHFEKPNIISLFNDEATESNILHTFRDIVRSVTPQDNLLIFFSGHGEYDEVLKDGFWIPVNAQRGAWEAYFPNSKLHNILNAVSSHHTFLIVDSCFSGTLFTSYQSKNLGVDRLEKDPSRWGLTAGRNEIVDDGKPGSNSPFADSVIYHLKNNQKSLGVMELCQKVMEDVTANADQTPRGEPLKVEGHRGGQFFFRPKEKHRAFGLLSEPPSANRRGSLLHNIPEKMELGRDTRCEVRIAFERAVLLQDLPADAKVVIKDIRISNLMEIDLLDPSVEEKKAFEIRTISEKEQFIEEDEYTQWVYYVKALKAGTFPLVLKVSVIQYLHGKERKRDIVLEEMVQIVNEISDPVEVANAYKMADHYLEIESESGTVGEPQTPPPPSPGAPAPSPTLTGGGPVWKDVPQSVPPPVASAPAKQKSLRGKLVAISSVLAILLAAITIIPDFFKGNKPTNTDPTIIEDPAPPPVDQKEWINGDELSGTWQVRDYQLNGASVRDGSEIELYTFRGGDLTLTGPAGTLGLPYQLDDEILTWGSTTVVVESLSDKKMILSGTEASGTYKIFLEKVE